MSNFYMILTAIGMAKMANAQLTNETINLTTIAVGDSNGAYYAPSESQTALVNEKWRGNINAISVDEDNPNWIVTEGFIPSSVGGFEIRELGLFDGDGDLFAIGKVPETYKPALEEGSTKDLYLKAILEVSNASSVTLKIDPGVIMASRKYVDDKVQIVSTNLTTLRNEFNSHLAQYGEYALFFTPLNVVIAGNSEVSVVYDFKRGGELNVTLDPSDKSKLIIHEKGLYLITFSFVFSNTLTGKSRVSLHSSNLNRIGTVTDQLAGAASNITGLLALNAGDVVQFKVNNLDSSSQSVVGANNNVNYLLIKKVT